MNYTYGNIERKGLDPFEYRRFIDLRDIVDEDLEKAESLRLMLEGKGMGTRQVQRGVWITYEYDGRSERIPDDVVIYKMLQRRFKAMDREDEVK